MHCIAIAVAVVEQEGESLEPQTRLHDRGEVVVADVVGVALVAGLLVAKPGSRGLA